MTGWEQLRALIDSDVPVETEAEVLLFPSSVDPAVVVDNLQEWFGQDDARSHVRIVVGNVDEGVLRRESLHELSASRDRGGLGSGDYATPPGCSTSYVLLHLVCSTLDCQLRITAVSFDPDDALSCPRHHTPLTLEG